MSRKYSVFGSFKFAFDGVREALTNEPNFQIHTVIGCSALVAGFILGLTPVEWILLAFTISFVLVLELINTAIEAIVDLVSPEYHDRAKVAKDVGAAAVFLASVMATFVGAILFFPHVLALAIL